MSLASGDTDPSTKYEPIGFAVRDLDSKDEVRGPDNRALKRIRGFDYVFFDWKGTLAKKSGLNTKQRTEMRLKHFYDALKELLEAEGGKTPVKETSIPILSGDVSDTEDCNNGDCNGIAEADPSHVPNADPDTDLKAALPTFDELQDLFGRLMKEHKGENGTKTFSWNTFICAMLKELGFDGLSDGDKHYLVTAFQGCGSADSGLHPGAEEIIRWLREDAGLRLGLIRNSKLNEQVMRNRIAKAGIDPDHFESVVMGGEVGFAKPDAEVFISAAKTANLESVHSTDPKRILYIGNEVEADVHGANGVGWTSVLVKHTEPSSNGLADYEIDHLLQLKDIVLRSRDDTEEHA